MPLHFVNPNDDDETMSLMSLDGIPRVSLNREQTCSIMSTNSSLSNASSNVSVLSAEHILLSCEVNERKSCGSDQCFIQVESLGRCLVEVLREQDDRISELESSVKELVLEQRVQSEHINSEFALNIHDIEELGAQIDSLSRKSEARDNELRKLTRHFEETSAECNVKSGESLKSCKNNDDWHSQLEQLRQCLETQIAETEYSLRARGIEGLVDRIAELEASQNRLDLEQKAQSEEIESEHALCTCEIEELRSQIDFLSRNEEVRNNDLGELTRRLEETSAELSDKFQKGQSWHAEVVKICRKNNEWCSQLEDLTQRLDTQIAEHNLKLHEHSEPDHMAAVRANFETFRGQFESRLASGRKIFQGPIEAGVKSHVSELQILSAPFDARTKDLTSRLDAEYADCKEKQEDQNQAEISRGTLATTSAEETSSQQKLIEAESILRLQIAQSSDRDSTERHIQLEDLQSRVKAEIETCADIIQEHKTQLEAVWKTCGSNRTRIEELACKQTRSRNRLESLWGLQQRSCQNVLETNHMEAAERSKLLTTLGDLAAGSADSQSKEREQRLRFIVGMQKLKHKSEFVLSLTRQTEKFGENVETAKPVFRHSCSFDGSTAPSTRSG